MDYPKSVPSVGLVNGKFVDENPVTGTPGSLIPAAWGNGVTQEILNVLAAAGIAPDETKTDQLAQALSVLSDWLKLRNKPTTLAGYGITDALLVGRTTDQRPSLSASDLTDTGNGLGGALEIREAQQVESKKLTFEYAPKIMFHWKDRWAKALAMDANGEMVWGGQKVWTAANLDLTNKADKATTLAGYGITDALAVGQYGLGGNIAPKASIDTVGLPGGFYSYLDGNTSFANYVGLVNIPYSAGSHAGQLGFQQGNLDAVVLVRGCDPNGKWTPTRQLWHDGNLKPGDMFPAGTTIQYAGPYPPAGFLKENGAEVSRTVYARLFAAIGTIYGAGDGSTTFNLPDSRGEFIRGVDDGRGVDPQRVLGSLQLDAMQGHWHGPRPGTTLNGSPGSWNGSNGTNGGYNIGSTGDPVTNGVNGAPRTGNETRPRNTSRLMCIKY
ncbi:tail fiber protein [Pseudomonas sp. G5001]|uniref:tail fiber protein n=1 Tax=unclassified Pseudomonas TaxID=196821 RepID=UPI0015A44E08|nr:tail fiber protein [Pseudomonas sp. D5002]NWB74230.1 tail fiber protein [Pseudomonas sp. G5001]